MIDLPVYRTRYAPEPHSIRIASVDPFPRPDPRPRWDRIRRRRRRSERPETEETRHHFTELADAARRIHPVLVTGGVPYRLCVYRRGDEVLLDVAELDDGGRLQDVKGRTITHDPFEPWVLALDRAEGVVVDRVV